MQSFILNLENTNNFDLAAFQHYLTA